MTLQKDIEFARGGVSPVGLHSGYAEFIRSKVRTASNHGFTPTLPLNTHLHDWQRRIVSVCLQRGSAALFADCGLGKTLCQLEWARHVCDKTQRPVMLHCPLGVRQQTLREASKFGIENVVSVDSQADVTGKSICVANYEKLHKFTPSEFGGVVLDESSILKNFTGSTKRQLISDWRGCQYKLACTATPAPNDIMELGNHADFLEVMPSNEMLSRWFINDTMKAGGYRLKQHAADDFWKWAASWCMCVTKPSDLGGSDEGYNLPDLVETIHTVHQEATPADGYLFDNWAINATNVHRQKRSTTAARASTVADLVTPDSPWLVWCDTNYEADALSSVMSYAVDVRGSDSDKAKSEKMEAFSTGEVNCLISKPSIAGFGMNWQHCSNMAFVGLSYSFEMFYQAVRRCWRFGQKKPVNVHIVESDGEAALRAAIVAKREQFAVMQQGMASALTEHQRAQVMRDKYMPSTKMETPKWK